MLLPLETLERRRAFFLGFIYGILLTLLLLTVLILCLFLASLTLNHLPNPELSRELYGQIPLNLSSL